VQDGVSVFDLEVVKMLQVYVIEAVKIPRSGSVAGFAGNIGAVLTRQDISTILQGGAGQGPREGSMSTVKNALAQKRGALIHVRSGDMVVEALRQMRDNRVRSVLVIDDDVLVGIVTQGDCAIKVLLPGLDAKETPVGQVMTSNPVTVKPDDRLEGCMALMAERGFRHLPVLDAGKVVGVISIGDVVKDIIRDLEHNVGDLTDYIMRDGPGG
jgi:CBS domain-containing protein